MPDDAKFGNDEFNKGPNDVWKDDDTFKNLAKKTGLDFNKLSYHCASMACSECDKVIRYKFKKFSHKEFNATTGIQKDVYEDFVWDYNHASVQLSGGNIQTPKNTPEGSKCQCFCHRSAKYKRMIEGTPSPQPIGRIHISQYDQKDLAPEVREELK